MLRAFNVFRTLLIVIACSAQEQYSSNFFLTFASIFGQWNIRSDPRKNNILLTCSALSSFFCYWDIYSLPAQEQYHLHFVFNPPSPVQLW